jgi:hypothetical protein
VLVRDDPRAALAERLVRAAVPGVPIGVEQDLDALAARPLGERRQQSRGVLGGAAVDEQQALAAVEDDDVTAGAGQQTHPPAKRRHADRIV